MKVAIVHDWLTGLRGGEKCLLAFLKMYPAADVHTLLHVPGSTASSIDERVVGTSLLQKLPQASRWYRHLLPLYPYAVKSLDVSGYDLVISLSHAAAKNIAIRPGQVHLCYCFTPMRYIWDQAPAYFGSLTPLLSPLVSHLRGWDVRGSQSVGSFVAISRFVKARIRCFYRRDAAVVYPPVETSWITANSEFRQGDAFLFAGALVPYKRPFLVVEAFNRTGLPLRIAGSGPLLNDLKRQAARNIEFMGHVSDGELAALYRDSRALIFPGVEDFGLMPVECMAAGRPVVGLARGGLRESLRGEYYWQKGDARVESPTGVFYRAREDRQLDSLISSLYYFLNNEERFTPSACVQQARRFSPEVFERSWTSFLSARGMPAPRRDALELPVTAAV